MNATNPDRVTVPPPRLRVLILEDDPRDAKLTARVLDSGNCTVKSEVTDSPEFFRESLEKAEYDVILADYNLRNWTAFDALEILKRSGKDIPLIVVTGSLGDEAAVECIKRGAADFVLKDRPARLPAAVQRALEEKRLRNENQRAFEVISRLATIVESSDAAIIGTTLEGFITTWNEGAEKLYGYSAAEALGQSVSVLAPPDHSGECVQMLASLRQGRHIEPFETIRLRKGGSRVDVSIGVFPLRDARGQITGAASISRDITERKRAEEALRESEQFIRAIVANAQEGIAVYDREFRYRLWNRFMEEMTGVPASEVLGKNALDLFPHLREQKADLLIRRALAGEVVYAPDMPFRVPTTGKSGWISNIYSPHVGASGEILGVIASIHDVSERKHAEIVLQESEDRFRSLFENATVGIYRTTPDGRVLVANPILIRMLGYENFEELAKRNLEEQWFEPSYPRRVFREQVERDGEVRGKEAAWTRRDGSVVFVRESAHAVRGESGQVMYYDGIVEDITERRQAEQALRESEELYRSVVTSVAEGIVLLDRAGTIVACNPSVERIFGLTAEKLIGRTPHDLGWQAVHEDGSPFPGENLPHMTTLRTGKSQSNVCMGFHRPDGTLAWILANSEPIFHAGEDAPYAVVASFSDITERKRAEIALIEERHLLHTLMDNLPDAIYFKDRDSRFLRINKAHAKLFGLSDPAQVVGKTDFGFFAAEHAQPAYDDEQEMIRTGQPLVDREEKETWPDGHVTWVATTKMPLRDANGNITGTFGVSRDITERKRAEMALVQSERRYRDFIAYSHEGVWRIELERPLPLDLPEAESVKWGMQYGYVAECNLALARLWGYPTAEELIGKRLEDLFAGNEEMIETIRSGARGKWRGRTIEVSYRDRAGNLKHLLRTEIPIVEDGKVVRVWGMTADRSEIKNAEAEKARLVTAIEQSAEAVVMTDTGGNIEYVNPAFTRITGYSREEALAQNPRFLKSGKHDPAFYQQLWATILKGEVWHGEVINRKKDGTLYTEEMNIAPVRNPGGEVVNFIATQQDVTARQELQQQLRQAQKMEAVGQLAGGVAHDFNNLLTIISGYGQLLKERLSPQDLDHLEEILKAGDRAATLTRQLLAFSRRQVLAPQVLDLNSVVGGMEKMLRRLIGEDIDFAAVQQPGLGQVKADPGQIEQVVMNLVVNARDAMPEGGKLTIETANVNLDEAYARSHVGMTPGPQVMLAVSDTGMGMDAEILAHIFEPFFTTKDKSKGTGLGLATVYGIVKQSSGYIVVYSEPGQGATFKIYLPRIDEPAPEAEAAKQYTELAKGSETVLVVEDEEGVRALVCETLKPKGYKVLEAREPGEALKIVEQCAEPIDLLLTDVVMPHMGGKELATHLITAHPKIKVLYMSGYTDDAVVRHGVLEAGTFFLQKPFVPSTLLRKVREVLDTKRKDG